MQQCSKQEHADKGSKSVDREGRAGYGKHAQAGTGPRDEQGLQSVRYDES
jgi:hypothetical protein